MVHSGQLRPAPRRRTSDGRLVAVEGPDEHRGARTAEHPAHDPVDVGRFDSANAFDVLLEGNDLVLTHYCAGGNQPTMRLDRAKATATELPFVFTGGTNLDPATDQHIHDTVITLRDDGTVVAHWSSYSAGEKGEDLVITLRRAEDAPFSQNVTTLVDEAPVSAHDDAVLTDGTTRFYLVD